MMSLIYELIQNELHIYIFFIQSIWMGNIYLSKAVNSSFFSEQMIDSKVITISDDETEMLKKVRCNKQRNGFEIQNSKNIL